MTIIEPHIHMYSRTTDDYVAMYEAGIRLAIEPSFWLGTNRRYAGTFFDYYQLILDFETERARRFGIDHYACLSVNPKEAENLELAAVCAPWRLARENAAARASRQRCRSAHQRLAQGRRGSQALRHCRLENGAPHREPRLGTPIARLASSSRGGLPRHCLSACSFPTVRGIGKRHRSSRLNGTDRTREVGAGSFSHLRRACVFAGPKTARPQRLACFIASAR